MQHPAFNLRLPVRTPKKGFTLIEILFVIMIVVFLAAMLFPILAKARENARKVSCINNLKQIGTGFLHYSQDYDEMLPFNYAFVAPHVPHIVSHGIYWPIEIFPYVKSEQAFFCPSGKKATNVWSNPWGGAAPGYHRLFPVNYMANLKVISSPPMLLSEAVKPSTTVLVTDGGNSHPLPTPPYYQITDGKDNNWILVTPNTASPLSITDTIFGAPNPRHQDMVNVTFLDGHVKAMLMSEFYFMETPTTSSRWLDPKIGG